MSTSNVELFCFGGQRRHREITFHVKRMGLWNTWVLFEWLCDHVLLVGFLHGLTANAFIHNSEKH